MLACASLRRTSDADMPANGSMCPSRALQSGEPFKFVDQAHYEQLGDVVTECIQVCEERACPEVAPGICCDLVQRWPVQNGATTWVGHGRPALAPISCCACGCYRK